MNFSHLKKWLLGNEPQDERTAQQLGNASSWAFDLLIVGLLADIFLYRGCILKQPFQANNDLWLLVFGCYLLRQYAVGRIAIRPVEFLRLPLVILELLIVLIPAILFTGAIYCISTTTALALSLRIAIVIPIIALALFSARYILLAFRRLDARIHRKVQAEVEAEAIIYSDEMPENHASS